MLPMQLPFKEADLPCVTRLQVLKFIGYDLRDPIPGDECSITPNINPYEIPDMTFCYDVYFMSASKTRPFKSRWSRKEHPNLLEWIIDLLTIKTSITNSEDLPVIVKTLHNVSSVESSVFTILPSETKTLEAFPLTEIHGFIETSNMSVFVYFDYVWQNPGEEAHFVVTFNAAPFLKREFEVNRDGEANKLMNWRRDLLKMYKSILNSVVHRLFTDTGWKLVALPPLIEDEVRSEDLIVIPTLTDAEKVESVEARQSFEPNLNGASCNLTSYTLLPTELPTGSVAPHLVQSEVYKWTGKKYRVSHMSMLHLPRGCVMRPHVIDYEIAAVFVTSTNEYPSRKQDFRLVVEVKEEKVDITIDQSNFLLYPAGALLTWK